MAETAILPVEAFYEMIQKTGLTISHSALSFTQTADDKPAYLLLTITQQLVDVPVTFTMGDDAAYFQLASDHQPYYRSTLTVVSSSQKFHVHVRYAADKRGLHTGQLTVQTPYESKIVYLEGRRKGWLPIRFRNSVGTSQPDPESLTSGDQLRSWVLPVMLAGMICLGYIGYTYKCQLIPGLCHEAAPLTTATKDSSPAPDEPVVSPSLPERKFKPMHRPEEAQATVANVIDSLSRLRHALPAAKKETEPEQATDSLKGQSVTTRATGRRRESTKKAIGKSDERIQPTPALTSEESELEKALNKPL